MHTIGLEYTEEFRIASELHNVSLTRNSSEIKRILNTLPELDYKMNAMFRELLLEQSAVRKDKQSYNMFSEDEYRNFVAQFAEGNERIAREYLGEEGVLFPDKEHVEPEWEPEEAYLTEDVIYFMGRYMMKSEKELQQLRDEVKQLRKELEEEKKKIKGIRSILKNPIAAIGRKMKSGLNA